MSPSTARQTSMVTQYDEVRQSLPERTLLFFRLGDFYELFNEDARIASKILGVTLTQRQGMPMAGVPYHAANGYLKKLLDAGWKVAVCDQLEPAVPGRIVRRAVTRIHTAGTALEDEQMDARANHYLLAFDVDGRGVHGAWLDVSTGQLRIASSPDVNALLASFSALDPQEILVREDARERWADRKEFWLDAFQLLSTRRLTTELPISFFDPAAARSQILETLAVRSLESFAISVDHPALGPAGAILRYAARNLGGPLRNVHSIQEMRFENALQLDRTTVNNLEIFRSVRGTREGSLLAAVDRTVTAAGARLLREFLAQPLLALEEIDRRQSCVGEFFANMDGTARLRNLLREVRDLLRMLGRLQNRIRQPREVGAILTTLEVLPEICQTVGRERGWNRVADLVEAIGDFSELRAFLRSALADTLPADTAEGGFLRDGFDEKLDACRKLLDSGERWLGEWEAREQATTGIKNLRIKHSGTFGYFIEVTKSNVASVPAHYIRRQTVVNGERYTTVELRAKEAEILEARSSALRLEVELFEGVVRKLLEQGERLAVAAQILAQLDVFSGWALLACDECYVRPGVDGSRHISIVDGRHPVIEQILKKSEPPPGESAYFVPNGTELDSDGCQIALVTGPNMGGKSTYVRQVALIVLLAQTGCWVPAASAQIGRVDRIFTRIGSGDDLSRGRSTFLLEMEETAAILHGATENSLVILDEIGRGTSTYDGLSIAWAVLEYLHGPDDRGPRTLFATHYLELTRLTDSLPRLRNFRLAVREGDGKVLFLRKILEGPADRSYGIHVAQLAGLPRTVIVRAQEILSSLEQKVLR
ncbi:MAG: DNA mismatch repair protein MutS [Puniceicoccales bacterium]|nr:DNA mismatch repair protein MutS [Puniceicoccales bacterium]